jgi:hypothetical protein
MLSVVVLSVVTPHFKLWDLEVISAYKFLAQQHSTQWQSAVILCVVYTELYKPFMLWIIMLNVIKCSVFMLSAVLPYFKIIYLEVISPYKVQAQQHSV